MRVGIRRCLQVGVVGSLIHQPLGIGRRSLELEEPALAFGAAIDQRRIVDQGLVDLDHLACERGVDLARGLHALDHARLVALAEGGADLGQLDEHHVAQLLLGMVGDADRDDVAIDPHPLVLLGEEGRHQGSPVSDGSGAGRRARDDPRRQGPAADEEDDLGAGRRPVRRDVAQGDRAADGGAEAAAGDAAERGAVGRLDLGALARRRLALGQQPDQAAGRAVRELAQDDRRTGEVPCLAAAFRDRPGEAGLDRSRGGVDVVAVQRQPGLEAQRVAGTQAGRRDLRLGEQTAG